MGLADEFSFDAFPTPSEFAQKAGCSEEEAAVVLGYVSDAVGEQYGVSKNGAKIAAIAIRGGMGYGEVAAVFASWYQDFRDRHPSADKE